MADSPRNARATKARGGRERCEANSIELNKLLAAALSVLGNWKLAVLVEACHAGFRGRRCKPGGHTWALPMTTCRFRLCAFEMRARAVRMIHRFEKKFAEIQASGRARWVVFSERSCGLYELEDAIKNLFESFERLRHRVLWSRNVAGCVAVLEVTFHAKGERVMDGKRWTGRYYQRDEWHPHLNVMWEGKEDSAGEGFIPHAALLKVWDSCSRGRARTASGKAAGVHIEPVRDLAELFKYVTKLAPVVANPELVDVFMRATHRVKLVRCFGTFYDFCLQCGASLRKVKANADGVRVCPKCGALDGEEEAGEPESCPDCGSQEIESMGRVWPEQLTFYDPRGFWRFDAEENSTAESPPRAGPDAVISGDEFFLQQTQPRLFADAAD